MLKIGFNILYLNLRIPIGVTQLFKNFKTDEYFPCSCHHQLYSIVLVNDLLISCGRSYCQIQVRESYSPDSDYVHKENLIKI